MKYQKSLDINLILSSGTEEMIELLQKEDNDEAIEKIIAKIADQTKSNCCEGLEKRMTEVEGLINSLKSELKELQSQVSKMEESLVKSDSEIQTGFEAVETGELDAYGNKCLTAEGEKKWLIAHATSQGHIAQLYNKTNRKRRCYSSQDIHKLFGGDGKGSERQMSTEVWEAIIWKYRK